MTAFLNILKNVLHFLGRVLLAIVRGTVKLARKSAPYIIKGLKYCIELLEKAMPYILKGLAKVANWIVKLIPKAINAILLAVPFVWKGLEKTGQKLKESAQKLRQKIQERKQIKQNEKNKLNNKSKDKTQNKAKGFARATEKVAESANKAAVDASLAIGALGGAGLAVDAIVNSGQCTVPELALPALVAGMGTYAIHKVKQNREKKEELFEEGTKQIVKKVANTKKMALAKETVSNDR